MDVTVSKSETLPFEGFNVCDLCGGIFHPAVEDTHIKTAFHEAAAEPK